MKKEILLKSKKWILIAVGVILLFVVGGCTYVYAKEMKEENKEKIMSLYKLKKKTFLVEYGDGISLDVRDYIEVKDDSCYKDMKLIIDFNDQTEFPSVGVYEGIVEYKDTFKKFKVQVQDTKAPVFIKWEKDITIYKDSNIKEVLDTYFEVEDLNEFEVYLASDLDFTKQGIYNVEVCAKDIYENLSSVNVTFSIKEETKQILEKNETKQNTSIQKENNLIKEDEITADTKEEVSKEENDSSLQEKPVYTLPSNYVDNSGVHYEYFWEEEKVQARSEILKSLRVDWRWHTYYFEDEETFCFELIWWE